MIDVNTFLLMMLYILGAILLVCLIVFVIKLISTINRVNGILDNVDNKISKLDNIFKIVDTMTDSLALFSDRLVDGLSNIITIDFGDNIDTSNVTSMSRMFKECRVLTSLDLSNFDTSKVMSMSNIKLC